MNRVKDDVIEELNKRATSIQSDDPDVLADNIKKVVYVSSNGNEEITNMISDLYRELQFPAISVANLVKMLGFYMQKPNIFFEHTLF